MAELTSTVAGAIAPAWSLLTAEHSMRFVFESLTDLAFVPSLLRVARRRRHFELFVGVLQFVSVTCYNVADALEVTPFLTARQWHELCNVTTITYALFLCIYLMGNRSENQDHFLRYSAFALVWMAQLRDNYWCGKEQGKRRRRGKNTSLDREGEAGRRTARHTEAVAQPARPHKAHIKRAQRVLNETGLVGSTD